MPAKKTPLITKKNSVQIPLERPSIYHRRLVVNNNDIMMHRRLLNYIHRYYIHNFTSLDFSPNIHKILEFIPSLCFVPCFFLAYTLCRYNELSQITIKDIRGGSPFEIKSSKSKHIRTVPALFHFKLPALRQINPSTKLIVIGYDHLRNGIIQSRSRNNIQLPKTSLDVTHIFRHLQSSYLFSIGVPVSDISYKLGHETDKTTMQYIHEDLFVGPKKNLKKES